MPLDKTQSPFINGTGGPIGSGPSLDLRPHIQIAPAPSSYIRSLSCSHNNRLLISKNFLGTPGLILHWKPLLVFCLSHSVPKPHL